MPPFQSESKCETISYENDFDLHENETACRTHFHMKGFVNKLVSLPPAGIFNKFLFNLQCFFASLRCPQLARWCLKLRHLNKVIDSMYFYYYM